MANKHTPAPGDWAFWPYDLYPYLLGGVISLTHYTGREASQQEWRKSSNKGPGWAYHIGSYNSWFRPVFVLPPAEGEALHKELKRLAAKNRQAQEEVKRIMAGVRAQSLKALVPKACWAALELVEEAV